MAKSKTSTQILFDGIKNLSPVLQGYLIDRLENSVKELSEQLPEWAASEASKNSMFHPNFFATYINAMNDIFDEIDLNSIKRHTPEKITEFKQRSKKILQERRVYEDEILHHVKDILPNHFNLIQNQIKSQLNLN